MIEKLRQLFKLVMLFGVSLVVVVLLIWVLGGIVFPLAINKNILFIKTQKDGRSQEIYLASFVKDQAKVQLIALDPEQELQLIGGYNRYRLAAVDPLLKLEKKSPVFQRAAWSWGLGLIVDDISYLQPQTELRHKKDLQRQLRWALINNWHQLRSAQRILELIFFTRSIPIEAVSFDSDLNLIEDLEPISASQLTQTCQLAVVNTTQTPGLAAQLSQVLEQSGGRVVRVSDQNSPYQLSTLSLAVDNLACNFIAQRVKLLFPDQVVKVDKANLRQEHRADLVIMVGQDVARLQP